MNRKERVTQRRDREEKNIYAERERGREREKEREREREREREFIYFCNNFKVAL